MFKWFAYDPDFRAKNYDTRFKKWIGNGHAYTPRSGYSLELPGH